MIYSTPCIKNCSQITPELLLSKIIKLNFKISLVVLFLFRIYSTKVSYYQSVVFQSHFKSFLCVVILPTQYKVKMICFGAFVFPFDLILFLNMWNIHLVQKSKLFNYMSLDKSCFYLYPLPPSPFPFLPFYN